MTRARKRSGTFTAEVLSTVEKTELPAPVALAACSDCGGPAVSRRVARIAQASVAFHLCGPCDGSYDADDLDALDRIDATVRRLARASA